ncbi:bifunctional oligoribonuclease/PAP phosphatase NrnA [Cytophagaceae bacterium ABcell3]|nr:bifunctional oligoribonuclease/PAP phosphatase NrnA [Cytophagaceae bacterium ABcell3]
MQMIKDLKELLQSPKNIVITTHHKPDADALGSSLALWNYLIKKGHKATVISPTDYPKFLHWMEGNEHVVVYNEGNEAYSARLVAQADIIFCLDFSALSRINELGELIGKAKGVKVLIDHHLEPEDFADYAYWDVNAAATAVLIFKFIMRMDEKNLMDIPMGECIYAGIMTDTGSFRHPTTTKEVHLIIADLINMGVDISKVHRLIYENNSEQRLRFLGHMLLNKLEVLPEYCTAYIYVSQQELIDFGSQTGDTEGLVNYALSLENVVFAAVIIEREDAVKLSFRSKGEFSVNDFARKHFEGGGHKNAAGGKSNVGLNETVEKFVSLLPEYKGTLVSGNKHENQLC